MRSELRLTFAPALLKRNLAVTLVVGTVLNLINQGDVLFGAGGLDILKLALTYCVPFLVASYGSHSSFRSIAQSAEPALPSTTVESETGR